MSGVKAMGMQKKSNWEKNVLKCITYHLPFTCSKEDGIIFFVTTLNGVLKNIDKNVYKEFLMQTTASLMVLTTYPSI